MNKLGYYQGYMDKEAKVLKPGIYMGSRDVKGSPIGRHQFFTLIPKNPKKFKRNALRNLGGGNKGIILSAFNKGGFLTASKNYKADIKALSGRFKGKNIANTELQKLWFKDRRIDRVIKKALKKGNNFWSNARNLPIKYPTLGLGINSNTFAQTLKRVIKGKSYKDFSGFNIGEDEKLPEDLFNKKVKVI